MTLDQALPGQDVVVVGVDGGGAFRRRLLELGLLPGTAVRRSEATGLGDPLSVHFRGALFALRRAEAALVRVRLP
jgi:ferrous iron transport protein A